MKKQEGIENLKYLISGDCTDNQMDFVKEIEMAIDALEKQTPKKLAVDKDGNLVCGNCGSYEGIRTETNFVEGYCWECGQKIDNDHLTEKGGEEE